MPDLHTALEAASPLQDRINEIPGETGWWHGTNGETYQDLARQLADHGLTDDEIVDVLESAFAAAADEFGG